MNFQQLRSVREALRRDFNLTEVAHALDASQPGVSRQIRELEDELGVAIFERAGKRLTGLTEPGRGIVEVVERLLIEQENLKRAALEFTSHDVGRLTVATTHSQARYALLPVVQAFRQRFPGVHLSLQQGSPEDIATRVATGRADIGIASEGLAHDVRLATFPGYRWRHVIVAPHGHPLLASPRPSLHDVARHPATAGDPDDASVQARHDAGGRASRRVSARLHRRVHRDVRAAPESGDRHRDRRVARRSAAGTRQPSHMHIRNESFRFSGGRRMMRTPTAFPADSP